MIDIKIADIASSIATFILSHDNIKNKSNYEIYNAWAAKHGVIIKDLAVITWIINYINDVREIPSVIIADALAPAEKQNEKIPDCLSKTQKGEG